MRWTEADFDRRSWHDCRLWGVRLDDIDWIAEWAWVTGRARTLRAEPVLTSALRSVRTVEGRRARPASVASTPPP